ncbi:MAG: Spo0B domain-containing protein [Lachnospiraceae bacterium]|nr:Spo0B domain-containing protein [Lachnospiraceae bacterium]
MKKDKDSIKKNRTTLKNIQQNFFRTQMILIITLALFLGVAGTLINIHFETEKRDQNLQNIAQAIATSPLLTSVHNKDNSENDSVMLMEYLDSLRASLDDIDVISVVNSDDTRLYHSNHKLIGTVYDGTLPTFNQNLKEYYIADDSGPSGIQRRAYAAIYNEDGEYVGFVMAIMLMENIREETLQTLFIFVLITIAAILIDLMISTELSGRIKESLMGYEPDVFSAMYQVRDNILETLDEGIIAIDSHKNIQFVNDAALEMVGVSNGDEGYNIVGKSLESICDCNLLGHTLESGEKEFNIRERNIGNGDILIDRIPIKEGDEVVGAVCILHNRTEYTKLMEDLTGTQYLVDSMRANNHDFTNKLHVILGLIQMEMYDEATSYIENITIVQRATISKIMNTVDEPAVAALLIGKVARASELNIKFVLREGCYYSNTAMSLPAEALVTIIGNLIDNAYEAMNEANNCYGTPKELLFGIYSRPGAVLITVDDTGGGISENDLKHIFENGYSTNGTGRGTGLYQVRSLVDGLGGTVLVESQEGVGTSISVSFINGRK